MTRIAMKSLDYPDDPKIVAVAVKFGDDGEAYIVACEGELKDAAEVMKRLGRVVES